MASSAIELRGVSKAFGGHQVIKDLNLAVPAQSIYAFLGNNGEGKSTAIRMVTGLLRPDPGGISVLGLDVQTERQAILRQIGALVDAPCFYPNLTGGEFLRIGCTLKGLRRTEIDRVLELVGLASARDRKISQFSLGMKLLVLDEPSNGLDPEGKCDMRTLLASLPAQSGVTVFVSSHNLDEVEKIATHVAMLKGGALRFQGSMADLQSRHTGKLAIDAGDAAHAGRLLSEASYQVEEHSQQQVVVRGVERESADAVHALLVHAGVRIGRRPAQRPGAPQPELAADADAARVAIAALHREGGPADPASGGVALPEPGAAAGGRRDRHDGHHADRQLGILGMVSVDLSADGGERQHGGAPAAGAAAGGRRWRGAASAQRVDIRTARGAGLTALQLAR